MVTIIGQLSRNIAQYFLIVSVIVIPYGKLISTSVDWTVSIPFNIAALQV